LFIEAVVSDAEAAAASEAIPDVPLLFNWAEGGKTPPISLDRLRELGYRIVIFPIGTLLAATAAIRGILQEIATAGTPAAVLSELPSFGEFTEFMGLPQVREVEQRYAATDQAPGHLTEGKNGSHF
jgi:2-methylisocitrate lyase-like PEP mutase family enzyme